MKKHFSSLPFVQGRTYVAIRNQRDRNFRVGDKYICSHISGEQHFHMNLQKDGSSLKFRNPEGIDMGYFGSVAVDYFSDDPTIIKEALQSNIDFHEEQIERAKKELKITIDKALQYANEIEHNYTELTETIEKSNQLGYDCSPEKFNIAHDSVEKQLTMLKSFNDSINEAIKAKETAFDRYMKTDNGRRLVNSHNLDDISVWEVFGEVFNSHEPNLGFYEGTLKNVILNAVKDKNFHLTEKGGRIVNRNDLLKKV